MTSKAGISSAEAIMEVIMDQKHPKMIFSV
jgi:hypothetical protein